MVNAKNYIDYPGDLDYDKDTAIRLWTEADAVYSHHGFRSIRWAMRKLRLPQKRFLIHFHGASTFDPHERLRAAKELKHWKDARGVVSTLDLAMHSGLPWLPAPYNVDWLQSMARVRRPDAPIRIAHAPTNRALKSTAEFLSAGIRLREEGYPIEIDVIENVTWAECIRRKAQADIYFDQLVLGYGCNALEAWGMDIPVIAGADDEILAYMLDHIGYLPFKQAEPTADSIYNAIRDLLSTERREHYARIGMNYLRSWHDYPQVRQQWDQVWL